MPLFLDFRTVFSNLLDVEEQQTENGSKNSYLEPYSIGWGPVCGPL